MADEKRILAEKEQQPQYGHPSAGPAPAYAPAPQTLFGCVTLNMSDRIRFIRFSQQEIGSFAQLISSVWPPGIQAQRLYNSSHEFKLKGNPWHGQGPEAIPSRRLMTAVLARLWDMGWIIVVSTDISKKAFDKDTLVFRRATSRPMPSFWCSISFNMGDKLRLIQGPPDLRDAITAVIGPALIQRMEPKEGDVRVAIWGALLGSFDLLTPNTTRLQSFQWKMRGYPWYADSEAAVTTRILLLNILTVCERLGWELYTSVDQSTGTGDNNSDTDSWYLRRRQDWQPGMTVYH